MSGAPTVIWRWKKTGYQLVSQLLSRLDAFFWYHPIHELPHVASRLGKNEKINHFQAYSLAGRAIEHCSGPHSKYEPWLLCVLFLLFRLRFVLTPKMSDQAKILSTPTPVTSRSKALLTHKANVPLPYTSMICIFYCIFRINSP